uniref:Long neurotoxin 1 n=1 Tax=Oxyuranus microlepidotus TaxID=111177 RepID=3L21_OXYMI|nr:RecName: Full=Long neurotoxin 1; Short=LNTX-1; Flags: Precursor [Oxyuranus microlepidotus]ABK63541.1 LNTX-1 precursor [Oxyuranus microlepidotus]
MKTLLLTLVVVTIVCLDLGYTRRCFITPDVRSERCPPGQEVCYTKTWCDGFCGSRGKRVDLGCAATCPTPKKKDIKIICCSKDNCNTFPKWP